MLFDFACTIIFFKCKNNWNKLFLNKRFTTLFLWYIKIILNRLHLLTILTAWIDSWFKYFYILDFDFKSYKNSHVINVRLNFVFGCFRVPVVRKLSLLVVNHGPQKLQALDVQILLWAVCYCTSLPHYFGGYSAKTSIEYVWFFAISQHLPSFFY